MAIELIGLPYTAVTRMLQHRDGLIAPEIVEAVEGLQTALRHPGWQTLR